MLEIKDLSVSYGKKEVLKDISLTFEKGKITSIVGPNGCGKTTLLNALTGIIKKRKNTIFSDGADIFYMSGKQQAKKIAYLPQGKILPDMTVETLVLHGRFPHTGISGIYGKEDKAAAIGALEELGISHLAKENIKNLSGGMRQNAFIAAALCQDTDYILLDEPTTYLDISNQAALIHLLKNLSESGKGIIAVMHDLSLAFSYSDSIVVMNNGTLVAKDSPEKIYASGIVKDIFGVEFKKTSDNNYYLSH